MCFFPVYSEVFSCLLWFIVVFWDFFGGFSVDFLDVFFLCVCCGILFMGFRDFLAFVFSSFPTHPLYIFLRILFAFLWHL